MVVRKTTFLRRLGLHPRVHPFSRRRKQSEPSKSAELDWTFFISITSIHFPINHENILQRCDDAANNVNAFLYE